MNSCVYRDLTARRTAVNSWVYRDFTARRTAVDLLHQMDLPEVQQRLCDVALSQKNSQKDSREQLGV